MSEEFKPQHIIGLKSENVKRIKAVQLEFTPEGQVVVIAGDNEQGKSSLLDSIMYVLSDARTLPSRPVREGEDQAKVTLETEDFIFTRTIKPDGKSTLVIQGRDKGKFSTPDALRQKLVSPICFDPLEFMRLKPKDKAEVLAKYLGLDLDALDRLHKTVYEERTMVNRDVTRLTKLIESLGAAPQISDAPSIEEALQNLEAARDANRAYRQKTELFENMKAMAKQAMVRIETLKERLKKEEDELEAMREEGKKLRADIENSEPVDLAPLEDKLKAAQDAAERVSERKQRDRAAEELKEASAKSEALTKKLEDLKAKKQKKIQDAKLPVEGISFGDEGLLFNGQPIEQASQAQQIKICTAIGIASNPTVRALICREGSLLDKKYRALMCELAKEMDMHIFMEVVGKDDDAYIVIEDGEAFEGRKHEDAD